MNGNIISALIAFICGTAVALVNSFISKKAVDKSDTAAMGATLIRSLLNIVCFALTYLVARKAGCEMTYPLVGVALGLTIPSMLFAFMLANKLKTKMNTEDRKEDEKE